MVILLLAAGAFVAVSLRADAALAATLACCVAMVFVAVLAQWHVASRVVSAYADENDFAAGIRRTITVLTVAAVVLLGGLAVLFVNARRDRDRDWRIANSRFRAGTPRTDVISALGKPDVELTGGEIDRAGVRGSDCSQRAASELDYFGSGRTGNRSCTVYLDREGRVLCVEQIQSVSAPR